MLRNWKKEQFLPEPFSSSYLVHTWRLALPYTRSPNVTRCHSVSVPFGTNLQHHMRHAWVQLPAVPSFAVSILAVQRSVRHSILQVATCQFLPVPGCPYFMQ
jgi:hypothetical protein